MIHEAPSGIYQEIGRLGEVISSHHNAKEKRVDQDIYGEI